MFPRGGDGLLICQISSAVNGLSHGRVVLLTLLSLIFLLFWEYVEDVPPLDTSLRQLAGRI